MSRYPSRCWRTWLARIRATSESGGSVFTSRLRSPGAPASSFGRNAECRCERIWSVSRCDAMSRHALRNNNDQRLALTECVLLINASDHTDSNIGPSSKPNERHADLLRRILGRQYDQQENLYAMCGATIPATTPAGSWSSRREEDCVLQKQDFPVSERHTPRSSFNGELPCVTIASRRSQPTKVNGLG